WHRPRAGRGAGCGQGPSGRVFDFIPRTARRRRDSSAAYSDSPVLKNRLEVHSMAKAQILIVEDDHDLREALVTTLELAKFQVREAANAEDALVSLARAPVDMVVSDVNMPGMSGHELLAEVQRLYPGLPM